MLIKCVECDHVLIGDEAENLYKGKSYCDDCYKAAKGLEAAVQQKGNKS
jgi:hypothetical protein